MPTVNPPLCIRVLQRQLSGLARELVTTNRPFLPVTSAVEHPYRRLAPGTVEYRTSVCDCWVTLWVTQEVPLRQDFDCGGI